MYYYNCMNDREIIRAELKVDKRKKEKKRHFMYIKQNVKNEGLISYWSLVGEI